MPLLLDELFTCPNCSVVFQSKIVGSYDTFGKNYSDLYIASQEDPQPVLHLINICPKCGFAAYSLDFRFFDISLDLVKESIKKTEDYTGRKATEFNVGDGYLLIAEYLVNKSLEQRTSSRLQACYAYRELKDKNLDKTRKLVLKSIEEILHSKTFNQNPEEVYLYLAGEINRLLGNNLESLEYFELALNKATKNSVVSKLTQHQLTRPREEIPKDIVRP
ncbi:MAG: DUF2225 domain-containing protein [Candidatus Heimdallarchaeota archaeon]